MSIKRFEDSYDLVNYLCEKDNLGELIISFSQDAPYPSFGFENLYPELEDHLLEAYSVLTERMPGVNSYEITIYDAEDFTVDATEYDDYSNPKLTKEVNDLIDDIIKNEYNKRTYASLDIEGKDMMVGAKLPIENLTIKKLEIYEWDADDEPLKISKQIENQILEGICNILSHMYLSIECIDSFSISNYSGSDQLDFMAGGAPYISEVPDLQDGNSFDLDTSKIDNLK